MFLGHTQDDGQPWSSRDRELAQALLLYEDSLCQGCGADSAESHDPDHEGWYLVDVTTCAGCKARDIESQSTGSEPGVKYRVRLDPDYVRRS